MSFADYVQQYGKGEAGRLVLAEARGELDASTARYWACRRALRNAPPERLEELRQKLDAATTENNLMQANYLRALQVVRG